MIWDRTGRVIASARVPLALSVPAPGYGEQDPRHWWDTTAVAVSQASAGINPARFAAIAVAHQRESFACLDGHDEPVRPAMLWLDRRATVEVEQAGTTRVHELTGKPANPTPAYYKLLWMREHEPDLLAQTQHVVDVHGYLIHRMTGTWLTSTASADPLGLVDLATFDYDDSLLADVGLDRSKVSALVSPGDPIGTLSEGAAGELGLPAGLAIVSGAGDGQAAALGSNISAPGRAYLNLGTGVVAGCYSEVYEARTDYRALTGPIPGTYSYEVFIGAGTYLINWFVDTFVAESERGEIDGTSIFERLSVEASAVPLGSEGLLVVPYWNAALTPYWDHNARGMMFGLSGIHSRAHIYRAVLEGLAFELRLCFAGVDEALPVPVETIIVMGGGARSELWCQILADVLGRPVVIAVEEESTSLGAAILAAAGAGWFANIREAALAMSQLGQRFEPRQDAMTRYEEFFAVYRELYPSTRNLARDLAVVTR
ncbi:MAG: carbohydrate kinase [Microbacteriaceae bacterium]|nr:carbohydrate kinase [Microbacteriaceae bacterium]